MHGWGWNPFGMAMYAAPHCHTTSHRQHPTWRTLCVRADACGVNEGSASRTRKCNATSLLHLQNKLSGVRFKNRLYLQLTTSSKLSISYGTFRVRTHHTHQQQSAHKSSVTHREKFSTQILFFQHSTLTPFSLQVGKVRTEFE